MAENKAILPDNAVELSPADRVTILKTVADETRLAILALLAEEDSYVERIAAGLSLTPATVCYHLKKLESVGLVSSHRTQFYQIYTLNHTLLDLPLGAFLSKPQPDADKLYRDKVWQSFFSGGRLPRTAEKAGDRAWENRGGFCRGSVLHGAGGQRDPHPVSRGLLHPAPGDDRLRLSQKRARNVHGGWARGMKFCKKTGIFLSADPVLRHYMGERRRGHANTGRRSVDRGADGDTFLLLSAQNKQRG